MSRLDRVQLLRDTWLCALPDSLVEAVSDISTLRGYARKQAVFHQGDDATAVYVIADGHVRLLRHTLSGDGLVINILGPGSWFGELSLVDAGPRLCAAECMDQVELLVIQGPAFVELLKREPALLWQLTQHLCHQIRVAFDSLEDGFALPAPARLARRLIQLASTHGREHGDGVLINLPLSHRELSGMLGLARPTVSGILSQWKRSGVLQQCDKLIVLSRIDALWAIAEGRSSSVPCVELG